MRARAGKILFLLATLLLAGTSRATRSPAAAEYESYRAHVAAAYGAIQVDRRADAIRWLEGAPVEHRGWEWHYLRRKTDPVGPVHRLEGIVPTALDLSPDGRWLAVATTSGEVQVLDSYSLHLRDRLPAHDEVVYAARFDPEGETLATVSRDGWLRRWRVRDGARLSEVAPGGEGMASIAWSPRGDLLAYVSWHRPEGVRGLVVVYDAASGSELWRTDFHEKPIVAVEFSADGTRLAVGTWGWRVAVWSLPSGDRSRRGAWQGLPDPTVLDLDDVDVYAAIDDIAFSADGGRIAVASKDRMAHIWDLDSSARERRDLRGHSQAVSAVEWADDGKVLLTGAVDGSVKSWSPDESTVLTTVYAHDREVLDLERSPDGERFFSASSDGSVRSWSTSSVQAFADRRGRAEFVYALAVDPSGSRIVVDAPGAGFGWWDATDGQLLVVTEGTEGMVNDVALDPRGTRLAAVTWDPLVEIRSTETGALLRRLDGQELGSARCRWSPDGAFVTSASRDGSLRIWSAETGELQFVFDQGSALYGLDYSPNGDRVAAGDAGGQVVVYDLSNRAATLRIETGESQVLSIDFDMSGRWLATGSDHARVHDASTGELVHELRDHTARVWCVSFSPDGSRLATASADQTVRLWDTRTGACVLVITEFSDPVYNVAFTPDGERLIANSSGTEIRIFDAGPAR